jgi:hypothetical protein|tara:strand:- start:423 stop:596 length:174 start_codon:yes stop_codon:yes gene_type:complete
MPQILPMILVVAAVFVFSLLFGDWEDIFPKRKSKVTMKFGDDKITYDRKTGKVTKHK